jgi:diacylglycerol kinase family enzyme
MLNMINSIASLNKLVINLAPYKRRYIVFINPIGGKGKAIATWSMIREIFDRSYINLQIIRTEHYRHAYDLVLKLEKKEVYLILN